VGVGAFWPIIVVALLIYALRRKGPRTTTADHGV
jgi:hypothetical protein